MQRIWSHLQTAVQLIKSYNGNIPLSHYLKKHFGQHKKYGSKDRKQITHFCYLHYRLCSIQPHTNPAQSIPMAAFLSNNTTPEILAAIAPEWVEHYSLSFEEKLHLLKISIDSFNQLKLNTLFSSCVPPFLYYQSFFTQPTVYARIRPGQENAVTKQLQQANIQYKQQHHILEFEAGKNITDCIAIDKQLVIQDRSSQLVLSWLSQNLSSLNIPDNPMVWDCCAASGGKSILLFDLLNGNLQLTVSDIRSTILSNLKERFHRAGITAYHSFLADLNSNAPININKKFDLIICDAPCSGSGTWARTPEDSVFFDIRSLEKFSALQFNIVGNAIQQLKPNGILVYITCSAFAKENESNIHEITAHYPLSLLHQELINGIPFKADTMFVAFLQKKTNSN